VGIDWGSVRYERPLVEGVLLRRFQRFLAEVSLEGRVVRVHVPNSGSMRTCSQPGSRCWVLPAAGPHRKLAWTLEQVAEGGVRVGVNTSRANHLAAEALAGGVVQLPGLRAGWSLRREVPLGHGSRVDFLLTDRHGSFWVEVKNVTWVEGGVALFPDAVTARGARHVEELGQRLCAGDRAAILFVVQRRDAGEVRVAATVDPASARAVETAREMGLVAAAVEVAVTQEGLVPTRALPVLDAVR
jgi:sugar fermentation stimulation protein A